MAWQALKLRVVATPVKAKANKAIVDLLSTALPALDLPAMTTIIVSERTSAHKSVEIDGLSTENLKNRLNTKWCGDDDEDSRACFHSPECLS